MEENFTVLSDEETINCLTKLLTEAKAENDKLRSQLSAQMETITTLQDKMIEMNKKLNEIQTNVKKATLL